MIYHYALATDFITNGRDEYLSVNVKWLEVERPVVTGYKFIKYAKHRYG